MESVAADYCRYRPARVVIALLAALLLATAQAADMADMTDVAAPPTEDTAMLTAAEHGDANAQYCLANQRLAHEDEGAERNRQALQWLHAAAEHGDARAQARLGLVYYTGRLLPQDFAEAARWYQQAADAGDRTALLRLAKMYRTGKGVPLDPDKANALKDAAAHAAHLSPAARCHIARTANIATNTTNAPSPLAAASPSMRVPAPVPTSTPHPNSTVPDALRQQAESGNAAAQYQLGNRYYREQQRDAANDAEAQKWFLLAATQGYALAEDRLGSIYYMGRGVPQDYAEAAKWYQRAADHGNVDAMTRLGGMYRDGKGVPRDRDEAHKWTNRASDIAARPERLGTAILLGATVAGVLAFAAALNALQAQRLSGWKAGAVATFVHLAGVALVCNTLVTFGLPELLFPDCSYGFLAASCAYYDKTINALATALRNWQMVNLVFTFMGMIGLVFHVLAVWYGVYLVRRWRRRLPPSLTS